MPGRVFSWFITIFDLFTIYARSMSHPGHCFERYGPKGPYDIQIIHRPQWYQSASAEDVSQTTMRGPPVISWFISPSNYSYKYR